MGNDEHNEGLEPEMTTQQQFEEVWVQGYDSGFKDGSIVGYEKGYAEAIDEMQSEIYNEGRRDGYADALKNLAAY